MKDLTKYFIDLSKCTEQQRKHIISLLPEPEKQDYYEVYNNYKYLQYIPASKFGNNRWMVDKQAYGKTELTYPEFIKLFENGSLSLQTKLEMFYDFLYERGVAKQLGVGIDTIVKHFIDEKLLSNDR